MRPGTAAPFPDDADPRLPAIYVASLADYSAGRLHGTWVTVDHDEEALAEATTTMLATSLLPDAEEWAIHDHENFAGLNIGEFESFATIAKLAVGIRTYGRPFAYFAAWRGHDDATFEAFESSYEGAYRHIEDWVDSLFESEELLTRITAGVPAAIQPYVTIDVAGFARDQLLSGSIFTVEADDGVHVFASE